MIRHRPFGSEHPYATTDDQRIPTRPEVGEPVVLGVTAAPSVAAISCQWIQVTPTGQTTLELPLTRTGGGGTDVAAAGGEGHLAAAQARAHHNAQRSWQTTTPPLAADADYRYQFVATSHAGVVRKSRTFTVSASQWVTDPQTCTLQIDSNRLVPGSVSWRRDRAGYHRMRFALHLRPDEHVAGFGERFDALDQRGRVLDAVVFEQYKSQGDTARTYLPMPFAHVVSSHGSWGFHIRTSRRTYYDVAASTHDRLIIEVDLGGTDHETVDVGTYTGPNPAAVLDQFLADTGRPEELPAWVFRLWASGNEWNTQDLVLQRMNAHRALDIPVGAVVIEAWSDETTIAIFRDAQYTVSADGRAHAADDFSYPPDGAWPDPKGMIEELHRRGIKVILWQIPLQKMRPHPHGQARADADALIRDQHAVLEADGRPYRNRGWWFPQALMPDLSTQRTRNWWTDKRRYLVADLDVDGFKTDGGEHAWGHDLRYADGRRGDDGNDLFPVHYARAFGDLLRRHGKAPVTFSRAGYTGSPAHGIIWAGDENSTWEAFRHSITAGLTASASGILYWSWDLAGFSGPIPDPELYLRATAAATFMPIMQYHSEFNHHRTPLRDRTPWNIAEQTGDDTVIDTFRHWTKLRDRLIPYLSQQARTSITTGRPLMRAGFFDHPDDPEIWNHPYQYQLGDDLLINPITEPGAATWATYLPEGEWIDPWTGEQLTGQTTVSRAFSLAEAPVYCRATSDVLRVLGPDQVG